MIRPIEIDHAPAEADADECSFGVEESRIRDVRFGYHRRSDGSRVRVTVGASDFFACREQLRLDGLPHTSRHVCAHLGGLLEDAGMI